jgi:uncharacterized protein
LKLGVLKDGEKDEEVLRNFSFSLKPNYSMGIAEVPGAICFDMTRACNLQCTYCFAQNDAARDKAKHLTFEDALAGLQAVLPSSVRSGMHRNRMIQFSFFGGEPLMRWDTLVKIVEHIKAWLPCKKQFHVTTNATLITPEIAKYLSANNFTSIISIDGTEVGHNECRIYGSGKGSYADVRKGMECMREHAANVLSRTTLRSTFTPVSIQTESLAERIIHVNDLIAEGYGSYASVEPAFLGEATCADRSLVDSHTTNYQEFREMWHKQYDDAADAWLERVREDKPAYFHHYLGYGRKLVNSYAGCSECGAGKGYFTIAPGGELYACHHEGGTRVGNAHAGGIDRSLTAAWEDNRYYARIKCPECPLRNLCGGGCREYSVSEGLGVSHPVRNECELKWILIKNISWLMYKTLPDPELRDRALKYWGASQNKKKSCTPAR